LNLITWSPVINANKYRIYRYDPTQKVTVEVEDGINGAQVTKTYMLDWVSWDNQLQDGTKYEYTIVSVSSESTSEGGINGSLPVQNGSTKTTITAKIPASLSAPVSADDIDYELIEDSILVKVKNTKPNYGYSIGYVFGTQEIVRAFDTSVTAPTEWFNPVKTARFFTIGGESSILVSAAYGGPSGYYNNTRANVSKPLTGQTLYEGAEITLFTATWAGDGEPTVNFSWSGTGESYEIYKAIIDKDASDGYGVGSLGTNPRITVKNDWAPVTTDPAELGKDDSSATESVDSIAFDDWWIYAIVAKDADGNRSLPAFDTLDEDSIVAPQNFQANYKDGTDNSVGLITWTLDGGDGSATSLGDYRLEEIIDGVVQTLPITLTEAANYKFGYAVVERTLATGKKYQWKLTILKGGTEDSIIAPPDPGYLQYGSVAEFKILNLVKATNGANTGENDMYTSNMPANSISLKLVGNGTPADKAYTVTLYRRIVGRDGGGPTGGKYTYNASEEIKSTSYQPVTLTPAQATIAKDAKDWYFTDSSLDAAVFADLFNIYHYIALVDNVQVVYQPTSDPDDDVKEFEFQPIGLATSTIFNANVTLVNDTNAGIDITASGATTKPKLPGYSFIIGSGTLRTASSDGTTATYLNSGDNIAGAIVKVTYDAKKTDAVPRAQDVFVPIGVASASFTTGTGNAGYSTTQYYYYITLPGSNKTTGAADADLTFDFNGDIEIQYPWAEASETSIAIAP